MEPRGKILQKKTVISATASQLMPQLWKLLAGFSTRTDSMLMYFMWIFGKQSGKGHAILQTFQFLLSINITLILHTHLQQK